MRKEKLNVKVNKIILLPLLIGLLVGAVLMIIVFKPTSTTEIIDSPVVLDAINEFGELERQITLKEPTYTKSDLTAEFYDTTDEKVLNFQLKSHKTVDEVLKVGAGNQVVMYYDINSTYELKDALGVPEFIDMKTGKVVERDWRYVVWGNETRQRQVCAKEDYVTNGTNSTLTCVEWATENYQRETWLPYNSRDLKGVQRIGIEVEVEVNDYMDGIWNIGGKSIDRHAEWTASLETDLISWWTLNSTTVPDMHGNNDLAVAATPDVVAGVSSITNNSLNFDGATEYLYDNYDFPSQIGSGNMAFNIWINFDVKRAQYIMYQVHATPNRGFYLYQGGTGSDEIQFALFGASDTEAFTTATENLDTGTWYMITFVRSGSRHLTYINANLVINETSTTGDIANAGTLGNITLARNNAASYFDGKLDEPAIWKRALTGSEITNLYNDYYGCTYGLCNATIPQIEVTLTSPTNNTNFTTQNINLNGTVFTYSDTLSISNVTLLVDGNVSAYNSSGHNGTYNFTVTLSDGSYNWTIQALGNDSVVYNASNGTLFFKIDTAPTFTVNLPTNNSNHTTSSVSFDIISSQDLSTLIINYNGTNRTISTSLGTYTWHDSLEIEDGNHELIIYGINEDTGVLGIFNEGLFFNVDANAPVLNVSYPNETIPFHEINTNLSLNWTVTDANLDSCWFDWNGANTTVTCGDNSTTFNITDGTVKTLTFYANDTFGNTASETVTWDYRLFLNYQIFDATITEGQSTTFKANFNTNGSAITVATLDYNTTAYTGTINNHGGNNYTVMRTITVPAVTTETIMPFFWNITQGAFNYALDSQNQTILDVDIDDCTTNKHELYNFTFRDEEYQTSLNATGNNTLALVNLQIYGSGTNTLIAEYNKSFSQTNPFAICLNSTDISYDVDAQVQYGANGYATELHHIQKQAITSASFNTSINLLILNATDSQVFKIIFRDSSFLPVEDALVKIYRKYIDENTFKITEIPKTDSRGEAVAHLVVNTIIYNIEIVKNGVTLATFNNVVAVCQTPAITSCVIDLNAFSESITIPDFEEAEDFSFTLGYNTTTRVISSVFSIPSGAPATILLQVTQEDALGTAVCTDTLTSTAGTLSCIVPTSFGNSTVRAKLFRDGDLQAQGSIKLDQKPIDIYGVTLVGLSIFIMMTLIGVGISNNPIVTTLFLMVGVVLLFSLNLVSNSGFIGATATILFFFIAVVIILIKGARRN